MPLRVKAFHAPDSSANQEFSLQQTGEQKFLLYFSLVTHGRRSITSTSALIGLSKYGQRIDAIHPGSHFIQDSAPYSASLKLTESQVDLKRKLRDCSFESNPIEHTKLRIRELSEAQSSEHLNKDWLDTEMEQRVVTESLYKKQIKESNQRIISLGDDMWKQSQVLRSLEEQAGLAPRLGPDAHGAYVSVLLKLYKDPTTSGKRSKAHQAQMRSEAIKKYSPGVGAPLNEYWCPIAQDFYATSSFKAAHIVPHRLGPEVVDCLFGAGAGLRLYSADNCLFIHTEAEARFDSGCFVLIPAVPLENPIKSWRIRVTNDAARHHKIGEKPLGELDSAIVNWRNSDERPAARFLYFHFVITLLRNKRDGTPGWEQYMQELPTGKPFASMGPYLRKSMLLALARAAGDLNEEYEAKILGTEGKELFTKNKMLGNREEEEIARRVMEVKDKDEDDDDDDDDDDDE
ncbi:MAG: hypothetical protein Q9195_009363 [Heterodermia aff. obscurata]